MGEGADIGAAVVYLASREAGYVTGPDAARQRRHGDDLKRDNQTSHPLQGHQRAFYVRSGIPNYPQR